MKRIKIILVSIAVSAIAVVAAFNVNFNLQSSKLSDISLANVEALATETGATITTCLGIWGSCSTSSGATSKAPLVEVKL
jgi:hypothetical protein